MDKRFTVECTTSQNMTRIELGEATLFFSYATLIAVRHPEHGTFRLDVSPSRTSAAHIVEMGAYKFKQVKPEKLTALVRSMMRDV